MLHLELNALTEPFPAASVQRMGPQRSEQATSHAMWIKLGGEYLNLDHIVRVRFNTGWKNGLEEVVAELEAFVRGDLAIVTRYRGTGRLHAPRTVPRRQGQWDRGPGSRRDRHRGHIPGHDGNATGNLAAVVAAAPGKSWPGLTERKPRGYGRPREDPRRHHRGFRSVSPGHGLA